MHTHTHSSHKPSDLQSRFGREKIIQRFKVQQIVKKNTKIHIVESFVGDDEKAQYASFKQIFI